MARPRIFISSTFYDLKHIRSSIELFIESLGFEAILSEKGDIAYLPDVALDESCYREAASADIFVLVVGGRYGSEVSSSSDHRTRRVFFDRYESITKKEFETAYENDIPVYILIESNVHAEYQTYQKNRDNEDIDYAHVDSANIFRMIEHILNQPRNNPVYNFDRSSQIENWLRDQWAGMFRELLRSRSQQKQLLALTSQVGELKTVNETLKTYLEEVLKGVSTDSTKVIEQESKRIEHAKMMERFSSNDFIDFISRQSRFSIGQIEELLRTSPTPIAFSERLAPSIKDPSIQQSLPRWLMPGGLAIGDVNDAREILGLSPYTDDLETNSKPIRRRRRVTEKPDD